MYTDLVLFQGIDSSGDTGLWATDGTGAGTWELSISRRLVGRDFAEWLYRLRQRGAVQGL